MAPQCRHYAILSDNSVKKTEQQPQNEIVTDLLHTVFSNNSNQSRDDGKVLQHCQASNSSCNSD